MKIEDINNIEIFKMLNIDTLNMLAKDIRAFNLSIISKHGGYLNEILATVETLIAMYSSIDINNSYVFFHNDHLLLNQLILEGNVKTINNDYDSYYCHKNIDKAYFLKGDLMTNLAYINEFSLMNKLDVYYIICDYNYNDEEISYLKYLAENNHQIKIINLTYNKKHTSNSIDLAFANVRNTNIYLKFKHHFSNSFVSNVNYAHYHHQKLNNKLKNRLSDRNLLNDSKIAYFLCNYGHDFKYLIKAFKMLKNNRFSFLNVMINKGEGYHFAYNELTDKYDYINSFDLNTGKNKLDDSIIDKEIINFISQFSNGDISVISDDIVINNPAIKSMEIFELIGYIKAHINSKIICIIKASNTAKFIQLFETNIDTDVDLKLIIDNSLELELAKKHEVDDLRAIFNANRGIIAIPKDYEEFINIFNKNVNINNFIAIRFNNIHKSHNINVNNNIWDLINHHNNAVATIISYGDNINLINNIIKINNYPINLINAKYINLVDDEIMDMLLEIDKPVYIYTHDYNNSGLYLTFINYLVNKDKKIELYNYGISLCRDISNRQMIKNNKLKLSQLFERIVK
ncbi:MAG: 1-deoxy-D-xylulose-5-phosphate synthase N-terminal domain-containing protein [Erysipelotrichaceae bacterium]|nr:1-deoxy-D-xylulose-5-phosphate synthase N-terminal domain-containing protein [Erysipelotrichaceae bacterium]